MIQHLSKNKQLSEDIARNLRCSGVTSARVVEVVAYEVVVDEKNNERKL